MKRILEDIKNKSFRSLYLLYGEEDYLKLQYRDKLISAVIPQGDDMNLTRFGEGVSPAQIMDAAEAMPFFMAERRLIVAEETGFFKKSPDGFSDFIKSIPDTAVLVFVESDTDGRCAAMNAAKKYGLAVDFAHPEPSDIKKWIVGKVKNEGMEITRDALDRFLENGDSDMQDMDRELEKLISYCLDKGSIEADDVSAVCIPNITANIWRMIDAFAGRDPGAAYAEYNKLLAAKESPLMILSLMERHFRLMYSADDLDRRGLGIAQIAERTGVRDFAIRNYLRQVRAFSPEKLLEIMNRMCDLEEKAKTGRIKDLAAVEIMIAEYCI